MAVGKSWIAFGGVALLILGAVAYPFLDMRANYQRAKGRVISVSGWSELYRVQGATAVRRKTAEMPCDGAGETPVRGAFGEDSLRRRLQYEYVSPVDGQVHRGQTMDSSDDQAIAPGTEINILVHTAEAGDTLPDPAGL